MQPVRASRAQRTGALAFVLVCALANSIPSAWAADDEWDLFAAERQHSVGVRIGDSDGLSWGADVELMLPANTQLAVDHLQTELDLPTGDETLSSNWAQFTTDPLARWSGQLTWERSGKRKNLQTEDLGFGIQYRRDHWQLGLRYLTGDVNLRTAPIQTDGEVEPRRFSLDRDGIEAEIAIQWERWHWSARYLDYSYERRIRLNPNSLALLRRLGFNTFQQVFGLSDWSAASELGYQLNKHNWRLGYSQYALELTDESGRIPYAGWDYAFNDRVSAGVMGALGLGDSADYGELSLRFGF